MESESSAAMGVSFGRFLRNSLVSASFFLGQKGRFSGERAGGSGGSGESGELRLDFRRIDRLKIDRIPSTPAQIGNAASAAQVRKAASVLPNVLSCQM